MTFFSELQGRWKKFSTRNQRYVMPLVLIGGFVVDWFTLNQIDQVFDNIIFLVHFVLSGCAILFMHATDERYFQDHPKRQVYRRRASLLMLFSFGALYSGFFIFYLRSASLFTSWVVVITLLGIMLSTEWQKAYYENRAVQIGIYYLALLLYSIFVIPILMDKIGAGIFIISGVVSILLITCFILLLRKIDNELLSQYRAGMLAGIIGVFMLMNFLYFMNIIPPIPLSMKFRSPYSYVEKNTEGGQVVYTAVYEKTPWYNLIHRRSHKISWQPGVPVYVFASVFAPTDIVTEVRHCWDWFSPETETWEASTCIPITIAGGRSKGYRGFSRKSALNPGRWRVRFMTPRDQVLGMTHFTVVEREIDPDKVRVEKL